LRAYHGTAKTGLTQLIPFANPHSNLEYACVYLSRLKELAALYIWDKPYKWLNFHFADDGHVVYTESFPNALEEFYGGLAGSIYTCEGKFEYDKNARIQAAVISRVPVNVIEEDFVPDALERILEYERQGLLEIRRYESLGEETLAGEKRMILSAMKRESAHTALMEFIQEKFPVLWAEGQELMAAPMTKEHIAFVLDLMRDALHIEDVSQADLRRNLRDPDEANFIIYRGDSPIGWLKLNGLKGETAWISMLAVHPAHQGQGAGRFAVHYAEGLAREKGFGRLGIKTTPENNAAQGCYEKLGYTLIEDKDKLTYIKQLGRSTN